MIVFLAEQYLFAPVQAACLEIVCLFVAPFVATPTSGNTNDVSRRGRAQAKEVAQKLHFEGCVEKRAKPGNRPEARGSRGSLVGMSPDDCPQNETLEATTQARSSD